MLRCFIKALVTHGTVASSQFIQLGYNEFINPCKVVLQVLQIGWVHHPTYSVVRPPTMSHQVCSPLLLNRTNGSNIWCWAPRPHIHAASRNAHASWYLATAGGQDLKGRPIPSATESWSIIPGLIWVVKKTMVIMSPRWGSGCGTPSKWPSGWCSTPLPIPHLLVMENNHLIFSSLSTCLPLHGL